MGSYLSKIIGNTFGISQNTSLRPEFKNAPPTFQSIASEPFAIAEETALTPMSREKPIPETVLKSFIPSPLFDKNKREIIQEIKPLKEKSEREQEPLSVSPVIPLSDPGGKKTEIESHDPIEITSDNHETDDEKALDESKEPGTIGIRQDSPDLSERDLLPEQTIFAARQPIKPYPNPSTGDDRKEVSDLAKDDGFSSAQTDSFLEPTMSGKDQVYSRETRSTDNEPMDLPSLKVESHDFRDVQTRLFHSGSTSPTRKNEASYDAGKGKEPTGRNVVLDPYNLRTDPPSPVDMEKKRKEIADIIPSLPSPRIPEIAAAPHSKLVIGTLTVEVTESQPEKSTQQPVRERIIIRREPAVNPFAGNESAPNVVYGLGQL
jgi:hypothetical protein